MESITFHCRVITPLFLAGADGRTPELRAPSIKGAMRFWWRALHGHLGLDSNVENKKIISAGLRDQETFIFGGTGRNERDGRSSFAIQVIDVSLNENKSLERLVPHKNQGFMAESYAPGGLFKVLFRLQKYDKNKFSVKAPVLGREEEIFNREKLIALFQLTSILGGLGRRVRRGMGCFTIESAHSSTNSPVEHTESDIHQIHELIKLFSPYFQLDKDGKRLQNVNPGKMEKYPWIKQIEIGEPDVKIVHKISQATHDLKQRAERKYEPSLGHSNRGRFSSPVYASVLPGHIPVVTTLNTVPDRDISLIDLNLQAEFKLKIL
jgi:CRISPR-associated protein Cmr1